MSAELVSLLTKIVLGSATQETFFEYTESWDKIVTDLVIKYGKFYHEFGVTYSGNLSTRQQFSLISPAAQYLVAKVANTKDQYRIYT